MINREIATHYEMLRARATREVKSVAYQIHSESGTVYYGGTYPELPAVREAMHQEVWRQYRVAVRHAARLGDKLPAEPIEDDVKVHAHGLDTLALAEAGAAAFVSAHRETVQKFRIYADAVAQGVAKSPPRRRMRAK